MKFQAMTRRAEGVDSYASGKSVSPTQSLINVLSGILSLLGAVVLILLLKEGSFTQAGALLDQGLTKAVEGIAIVIGFVRGLIG
ncbi:hypothetical protein Q1W73_04315 [Asticcacaulis sp. ZE23SCel15]|jgi:hypothetical protein|uniref:hypothetical protein n=1 Tax=Asticcacaulis sp. ZE23SCel15 TaxID=3059027 RepID=UPI00265F1DE0|nr:hypothetical protein [Asticcacaulis sp. ZE23SCel15]WKL58213.1 hypothetical protein Q1W73_04315 [Asticcacaulis sp. ZE23SCel15]